MVRDLLALTGVALIATFLLLIIDIYSFNIEIISLLHYFFSVENIYITLMFWTILFVTLIPTSYLIENILQVQSWLNQLLLYLVFGIVSLPLIFLILHGNFYIDLILAIPILVAFLIFGMRKKVRYKV
ncbi:hypothetical protein M3936_11740 [Sutcliffiella horikoshii]|uniref:hypothetical protein n=1 Tax=Sutcliffiella horikoshii TaxID=79883 RepID=UPI00203F4F3E|nr:hypothetical protein [Sutcliffiella horikoshii]MCM3618250.1 hypothetical protein [Sutcliffiella horikoshii]